MRGGRIVAFLLLAMLALGIVAGSLADGSSRTVRGSVFNESSSGRSLIYGTLRELGFDVAAWTSDPAELPDGGALLLLHDPPDVPPGYAGAGDADEGSGPVAARDGRRRRDPLHYLRFVAAGGVIVLPASDEMLAFLRETLGIVDVAALDVVERVRYEPDPNARARGKEPSEWVQEVLRGSLDDEELVLPGGETLATAWRPTFFLEPDLAVTDFEVALTDTEEQVLGVRYPYGSGGFVLIAPPDDWLDNDEVEEPGNALFTVRLIEAFAPGERVLFDEYALGGWTPETPLELAFATAVLPFSAHLVLWGLVALWAVAWTRAFPRDPVSWASVSALVRAQGFAGVLTSAGRYDLVAALLRRGVLRRLLPRVRFAEGAEADDALDPDEVREHLAKLPAFHDDERRARAVELLAARSVRDLDELERLGAGLARLERAASPTPTKPDHDRPASDDTARRAIE